MLVAVFAAAVALVGLLTGLIATNPSLKMIGWCCFTAGLAAALTITTGGHLVRVP